MKQKFVLTRTGPRELSLKEYSEMEKKEYTIVYETTYDLTAVSKAAGESVEALGALLRSVAFFPPGPILEQITTALMELLANAEQDTVEVFIDDNQVGDLEEREIDIDDDEAETPDLDDILDDDEAEDNLVEESDD